MVLDANTRPVRDCTVNRDAHAKLVPDPNRFSSLNLAAPLAAHLLHHHSLRIHVSEWRWTFALAPETGDVDAATINAPTSRVVHPLMQYFGDAVEKNLPHELVTLRKAKVVGTVCGGQVGNYARTSIGLLLSNDTHATSLLLGAQQASTPCLNLKAPTNALTVVHACQPWYLLHLGGLRTRITLYNISQFGTKKVIWLGITHGLTNGQKVKRFISRSVQA